MPKQDDDWFARAILSALQLIALGLSALVFMSMCIETANHAPPEMCVVFPTVTE